MECVGDQGHREPPPHEKMETLWHSTRVIQTDELPRLSKNIGSNWKAVGTGLKFNCAQLDQFESDTKSPSHAVYRMLLELVHWEGQEATVGLLTKQLFNHKEYDALASLHA